MNVHQVIKASSKNADAIKRVWGKMSEYRETIIVSNSLNFMINKISNGNYYCLGYDSIRRNQINAAYSLDVASSIVESITKIRIDCY
jgi:hypothetical protein